MYVFLERETRERKDGKYLLNSVAILVADWLYENKKKERERNIYFAAIIHWSNDREGKKMTKREIY